MTLGVSGGVNSGGGNAGANFNLSKTESDWVNEQTSLTGGGTVTIDVEDKTTLKGAVIASTTGDLTLETGSLEYSNIKDKDKSYTVGGGIDVGTKSNKSNANYEFSDKKQTNFATIGEGTIIVKDTETDLTKLNRDLTVAQYNTKEGGLAGGFTIDDATLEFMTNPEKLVTDTLDSLKQGYYDAKGTANKIITVAGEIADNLFKTDEEGKKENNKLALNPDVNKKTDEYIPKKLLLTVKVDGTELELEKDKTLEIDNTKQSVLDKFISELKGLDPKESKKSCNLTVELDRIIAKAEADGYELGEIDYTEIYKKAKEQGNSIIKGNFEVADVNALAKLIHPDLNYKLVDAGKPTAENIINQLDNNNIVKIKLSDSHYEKIEGYEVIGEGANSYVRFKIADPGYQGDKYIDSKTMQPYKIGKLGPVYSTEHNNHKDNRNISKITVLETKKK